MTATVTGATWQRAGVTLDFNATDRWHMVRR